MRPKPGYLGLELFRGAVSENGRALHSLVQLEDCDELESGVVAERFE